MIKRQYRQFAIWTYFIGLFLKLGLTQAVSDEQRSVIYIWPEGTPGVDASISEVLVPRPIEVVKNIHNPSLTVFRPEHPNGVAVVICPGGAYLNIVTGSEGYPTAERLNEYGITAFVLKYRLPTTQGASFKHPIPLYDALRALQWVRYHAEDYEVETNRIGIMGFSAGGHLAASVGTLYLKHQYGDDEISSLSSRPDFVCLGYPVISTRKGVYHGCIWALLQQRHTEQQAQELSCELNVSDQMPPTFLMHANDDTGVLPANSVLMHEALKKHGVVTELKLYETGGHGYGVGRAGTDSARWICDFIDWLDSG